MTVAVSDTWWSMRAPPILCLEVGSVGVGAPAHF